MFESMHDGDHDGVVRILVGLSCELGGLIIYFIIYITRHNFSPTRSVKRVGIMRMGVCYQTSLDLYTDQIRNALSKRVLHQHALVFSNTLYGKHVFAYPRGR